MILSTCTIQTLVYYDILFLVVAFSWIYYLKSIYYQLSRKQRKGDGGMQLNNNSYKIILTNILLSAVNQQKQNIF